MCGSHSQAGKGYATHLLDRISLNSNAQAEARSILPQLPRLGSERLCSLFAQFANRFQSLASFHHCTSLIVCHCRTRELDETFERPLHLAGGRRRQVTLRMGQSSMKLNLERRLAAIMSRSSLRPLMTPFARI